MSFAKKGEKLFGVAQRVVQLVPEDKFETGANFFGKGLLLNGLANFDQSWYNPM